MLHKLLNLTRPLIVLDCETTGTDPEADRIVQLGFQAWDATGVTKEFKTLVNPGVPIHPSSTRVHKITDAMIHACCACGHQPKGIIPPLFDDSIFCTCAEFKPVPRFKQLCAAISTGFVNCDFAGKRVRFDLRITAAEMARNGTPWSYLDARIVDADRLEQLAIPRSLEHLYEKYVTEPCETCIGHGYMWSQESHVTRCATCNGTGRVGQKMSGAHDALDDVKATAVVIAGQLEAHPCLPRDLDQLHQAQWPGWIDGGGKFKFVDGVPCFGQWGKFANRRMDDPEVSRPGRNGQTYWDFILGSDFSQDVKALARKAKLGQFPEMVK